MIKIGVTFVFVIWTLKTFFFGGYQHRMSILKVVQEGGVQIPLGGLGHYLIGLGDVILFVGTTIG